MILDSGARREFQSGAVRDIQENKGRCDLLPLDSIGCYLNDKILLLVGKFIATHNPSFLADALTAFSLYRYGDDKKKAIANMLLEVSIHYEEGCKKYGERNWQKGIPVHCFIDSAVRHYLKYTRGDSDEPHDRAFVWNILGAMWTLENKPELNDMPDIQPSEIISEIIEDNI